MEIKRKTTTCTEMCRVVGKVVLEMRDWVGAETHCHCWCAAHLAGEPQIQRSPLTVRLWRKSFMRFPGTDPLRRRVRKSRSGSPP